MKNRRNIVEQQNPPQNPNDIWLKDGKFYRSTSEGWTIIDSELEYTNKETMIADNPKGGTIGIDKESGEPSIYNDVTKQWSPLGGGLTETTWQELKDKRDAGKLTPGALYRITDYNCTTTQENTRSAGHQFDIVLLALSENKLAEEGWAMMHENDTYFANSNLSAWKVWYCLDNDKSRFAWADDSVTIKTLQDNDVLLEKRRGSDDVEFNGNTYYQWRAEGSGNSYTLEEKPTINSKIYTKIGPPNAFIMKESTEKIVDVKIGRGVIYRLVDEWNNDVPYDFKNILVTPPKSDESYLITSINHIDEHQDYSMLGKIRGITVSLCLQSDNFGNNKNAIPLGSIAPSLRTGEVLYNIKISSSALEDARQLVNISSNTIIGYTI